jgi:hypothetical protein
VRPPLRAVPAPAPVLLRRVSRAEPTVPTLRVHLSPSTEHAPCRILLEALCRDRPRAGEEVRRMTPVVMIVVGLAILGGGVYWLREGPGSRS